jgi:hypothetical protein
MFDDASSAKQRFYPPAEVCEPATEKLNIVAGNIF